jgi:hypothetical protein
MTVRARWAPDRADRPDGAGRRAFALAGLLATGVAGLVMAAPFLVAPAYADNLVVSIDGPSDGQTFTDTNTVTVSGKVATGLLVSVDSITVQVTSGGTVLGPVAVCSGTACGSGASVPFSYSAPFPYNGQYTVKVTATGYVLSNGLAVSPSSDQRAFSVAVPPAPPTNVKATFANGGVTVTWKPGGSYPDLAGFVVRRKTGQGAFSPVSGALAPTATSFTDSQPPAAGGSVQYEVVAVRQGADGDYLYGESEGSVVTLPVPSTTIPPGGSTTTSVTPGGGVQPGGAVSNVGNLSNIGSLFPSATGVQLPASSGPTPTLPDTGFSETLPFGASAAGTLPSGAKVDGRQPGRPSSSSGTGVLDSGEQNNSNRRALLVPVAAGCVLCVSALHLRWLNRRLASPSNGGPGGGSGGLGHSDVTLDELPTEPRLVSVR